MAPNTVLIFIIAYVNLSGILLWVTQRTALSVSIPSKSQTPFCRKLRFPIAQNIVLIFITMYVNVSGILL